MGAGHTSLKLHFLPCQMRLFVDSSQGHFGGGGRPCSINDILDPQEITITHPQE